MFLISEFYGHEFHTISFLSYYHAKVMLYYVTTLNSCCNGDEYKL